MVWKKDFISRLYFPDIVPMVTVVMVVEAATNTYKWCESLRLQLDLYERKYGFSGERRKKKGGGDVGGAGATGQWEVSESLQDFLQS